jgi:hypothetical protein
MKEKYEIHDLLVSLGRTAEEVANSLKMQDIKGRRGRCFNCPIANFLKKNEYEYKIAYKLNNEMLETDLHILDALNEVIGTPLNNKIIWNNASLFIGEHIFHLYLSEYSLLNGIFDFIRAFDIGKFIELEEKYNA